MSKTTTNPTVTVLKENLAPALALVGRAAATKSTLPILGNVLFEANSGRLRLSATNLEVSIATSIAAKTDAAWQFTLPFKVLSDMVNAMPADALAIQYDAKRLQVKLTCGDFATTLKGIEAGEFPDLPSVKDPLFSVPGDDLDAALERVLVAAATDQARPVLTGVFVFSEPETNTLFLAASDGFRVHETSLTVHGLPELKLVVPARALAELRRGIDADLPVDVQLYHGPGKAESDPDRIGFRCGATELVAQLLEGSFPNYRTVIPQQHAMRVVTGRGPLAHACKAADIIARGNAHTVSLTIVPAAKKAKPGDGRAGLRLSAINAETGDHESFVDANVEGSELKLAVNATFLREACEAVDEPNVALAFSSPMSPVVIQPATSNGYRAVIMPMHLNK